MLYPAALHITWGAHGACLHGSDKPHVDRDHNEYGEPFAPTDQQREDESRARMKGDPVSLSFEQRKVIEEAIRDVAQRYEWPIHAMAVQSDHVHVVITAPATVSNYATR